MAPSTVLFPATTAISMHVDVMFCATGAQCACAADWARLHSSCVLHVVSFIFDVRGVKGRKHDRTHEMKGPAPLL